MRIEILKVVSVTARERADYLAAEAKIMKANRVSDEVIQVAEKKAEYWARKAELLERELSVLLKNH